MINASSRPNWVRQAQHGDKSAGAIYGERGPADVYRYVLWRDWSGSDLFEQVAPRTLCFLMLNPSTATHMVTDPTITRCLDFAKRWKFSRLVVLNLFALRSTSPKILPQHGDPIGPLNDELISLWLTKCDRVVCAWGTGGILHRRNEQALKLIAAAGHTPHALEVTQNGQPGHPLYIPAARLPSVFHAVHSPPPARQPGEEG